MEQSKLISEIIAKLKIAYQYYFDKLTNEEFIGLIGMYQDNLSGHNELVLTSAVNSIISKNKFMPSIKEILDECKYTICHKKYTVLELMYKDGYFKKGIIELERDHELRNYEKAYMWATKGIIPEWLLEDMKKYGYVDEVNSLNHNARKRIEYEKN